MLLLLLFDLVFGDGILSDTLVYLNECVSYLHASGMSGKLWRIDGRMFCVRFSGNLWLNFNLIPYFGTADGMAADSKS